MPRTTILRKISRDRSDSSACLPWTAAASAAAAAPAACPACGAEGSEPCITKGGNVAKNNHAGRV